MHLDIHTPCTQCNERVIRTGTRCSKSCVCVCVCIDVLLGRIVGRGVTVRMSGEKGLNGGKQKYVIHAYRSIVVTLKPIVLCAYGRSAATKGHTSV